MPIEKRTPVNLAAFYSELKVPQNSKVLNQQDTFVVPDPNGSFPVQGVVSVELSIPSDSMHQLLTSARERGFQKISDATEVQKGLLATNATRVGVFKIQLGHITDNRNVFVLDSANNFFWVYHGQISEKW
ncbi:MAG: hypothetical protein ABI852_15685 [Gemmatimonadaceae bacterium]